MSLQDVFIDQLFSLFTGMGLNLDLKSRELTVRKRPLRMPGNRGYNLKATGCTSCYELSDDEQTITLGFLVDVAYKKQFRPALVCDRTGVKPPKVHAWDTMFFGDPTAQRALVAIMQDGQDPVAAATANGFVPVNSVRVVKTETRPDRKPRGRTFDGQAGVAPRVLGRA